MSYIIVNKITFQLRARFQKETFIVNIYRFCIYMEYSTQDQKERDKNV